MVVAAAAAIVVATTGRLQREGRRWLCGLRGCDYGRLGTEVLLLHHLQVGGHADALRKSAPAGTLLRVDVGRKLVEPLRLHRRRGGRGRGRVLQAGRDPLVVGGVRMVVVRRRSGHAVALVVQLRNGLRPRRRNRS